MPTTAFNLPKEYDVVVVGSGHAGIEAALAAARIGGRTLMLTQNLDTIGQMSCNPAIGGLAKGHIVREIDAAGGAMGLNADATGIQFRMKAVLERADNLDTKQATVSRILVEGRKVVGVETDFGLKVMTHSVVITAGTFLRGLLHVGQSRKAGGRMADASSALSEDLRQIGFQAGRFKTGTPCRLNGRSIDLSSC